MNENAKALYDDLKNSRLDNFNMAEWPAGDGPCGCIGWHADVRLRNEGHVRDNGYRDAADWLGLSPTMALTLFFPELSEIREMVWGHCRRPMEATQPEAAEALRKACEVSESLLRPEQNQL